MERTSFRATGLRWLRWGLIALVAVYALYLVAGNLFLNTALGERTLNRKPDRFQMRWSSGYTWWPGRVSLQDVSLQGQARRIAWEAQAGRVEGRIALWPLLSRRLHVPEVRADDVRGGVRRVTKELAPPPPRAGGWELQFDRIASDSIRRGYFDGMELIGTGRAEVGFYKQLRGGPMELMPSIAEFVQAKLVRNGDEVLRDATLDLRFAIDRHRREEAAGLDKLLKTRLDVKLAGRTAGLNIAVSPRGEVATALVPGEGQADIDLGFERGLLKPGGRATWTMAVAGNDIAGAKRNDILGIDVAVDEDIVLKAAVPPQADGRLAVEADLRLRGRQVPLRDFAGLLPRASGHVVGAWHFDSLRWLSDLFPQAPWLKLDGAGAISADVQVMDGKLAAGSRIAVPGVDATADVMGNRIRGRARADIRLDAGAQGELVPRLQAVMETFDVAAVKAPSKSYVRGRNLRLSVNADGPLAQARDTLKARVVFDGATVPDLRVYNPFLPRRHMRFEQGAGTLSGDLSLDAAGNVGHGVLRIAGRRTRMHLANLELRGDIDLDLKLRRADLRQRWFVVDGSTVHVRNVGFTEPGGESRRGWWARVKLDRARLDVDRPISAGGGADVTMKDVGFLLALFSRQKEYPAWVYRLVDAGQARVRGRVQWRDDVLVLDRMQASNDRYDMLARLRLQGGQRQGDLYARWRALSIGMEVQGDRRKLHLVRARDWYEGRPHYLD
ncbi:hypothetical protein [Pseudoxanthomonas sp. PXM02]|uniref:hypothetical protein n=1 Tax=Pseudoxanthomonas sp. PXM02 TaxID=2769294 RepID=UPI0017874933|nr:hypothetical protein [Pseudoxanthomonas sp. PXM02]MBD9478902.1 hypothetical protein [Pseudoxanthomonas sp. PXM02]